MLSEAGCLVEFNAQLGDVTIQVSVPLGDRERIGIVGPNGAGKSTLLKLWLALNRTSHPRQSTVLLTQQPFCFPHLTVLENVVFPLQAQGLSKPTSRQRAQELLERAGLSPLADRYPATLSVGQQQKVSLVRALAAGAQTLLLDEPLNSLDVEAAQTYRQLLKELTGDLAQLVIVSHDPHDLVLVDRVLVMDEGKLIADGLRDDVFGSPPNGFVLELVRPNPLSFGPGT